MDFVSKHIDKPWNWCKLSANGFNYKQRYFVEARRQLAAKRIQRYWMECRYNPVYKMCRYLFYKHGKAIFDEFDQIHKYTLDEETKDDIGDWLAIYDNSH